MIKSLPLAASLMLLLCCSSIKAPAATPQVLPSAGPAAEKHFEFVDRSTVQPALILPPPPARGSREEQAELAHLHALIAAAPAGRLEQAKRDDVLEDPSIFNAATGRDLASLPQTWALLKTVQNDADRAADLAKDYFGRTRPWGIDPTLHNCDAAPGRKPTRSYPSGHSILGYSVGYVLAQLMPARAPQILARAADYALSREYCAAHFASDTEASHVLGTLVAARLLTDPRLVSRIAAGRRELTTN